MARSKIRKCPVCGGYTLKETCSRCGVATKSPHPPPISPTSKYVDILLRIRQNNRRRQEGKDINI